MTGNRFADCETPEAVLLAFYDLPFAEPKSQADALARIAELTPPPTVSEEARERVEMALAGNYPGFSPRHHENMVSTIIAALGYTSTSKESQNTSKIYAPPPGVELDAETLAMLGRFASINPNEAVVERKGIRAIFFRDESNQVRVRIGGDYPLGVDE